MADNEKCKYLINETKQTAIKIPNGVLNTIHTKLRDNVNGYLKDTEAYDLVDFLASVPSGYSFNDGNRVWAHSEIGDRITF